MRIKDIVNRDIVNLTNCEQEPIHIPGSIQPHGFLIAFDSVTMRIGYCSANIGEFTDISFETVLGKKFGEVFGQHNLEAVHAYTDKELMLSTTPLYLSISGISFICMLHKSGNELVLEAEPDVKLGSNAAEVYDQTSRFLTYMHETHTLQELCDLVAKGTRELTGYDRVMIYRFDKDYNGEVFAESRRDDLEPFLGLHYPHTDIPPQARELYMQNLLRLISDINYVPVPIYTIDDQPGIHFSVK